MQRAPARGAAFFRTLPKAWAVAPTPRQEAARGAPCLGPAADHFLPMTDDSARSRPLSVPAGRLTRVSRLGALTAGVAGRMALSALGTAARGGRPEMRQLLMTPRNLHQVAEELSRMRGAAMKVGQLISMDAGEVLPPELAEILARLRDQAHFMPPQQLRQVLNDNWGSNWLGRFQSFEVRPLAAASIGQVHRARLRDGREVAIKVQYPGIARAIDSDVANVGALVRLSGLLPRGLELAPYLEEARRQLHEETDYAREGAYLARFGTLLAGDEDFTLPAYHADWSTGAVLTMDYCPGSPLEAAAEQPRDTRNRLAAALLRLTLREVFAFGLTQSDPNFANYRLAPDGRIVLLDFGATRPLDPHIVAGYRALLRAGLAGDAAALEKAAQGLGLITGEGPFDARILAMISEVFAALTARETFDFTDRSLSDRMTRQGLALAEAGYVPPLLPMDVLYLQRKFGGIFLLCQRLGATLPLEGMLRGFLEMD